MQARRTIFAQQNAKSYLNKGQNNMRVPHKNKKWCKQLGVVWVPVGGAGCRERSKANRSRLLKRYLVESSGGLREEVIYDGAIEHSS